MLTGLNSDVTTIRLDSPLGNGQTEPRTAFVPRSALVETEEPIEDAIAVLGGDTCPLVSDTQHGAIAVHTHTNVDRRGLWAVLDRVVDDVRDRVAQHELIRD